MRENRFDLKRMLKPSKIAVVGAGEKENLGGFTVRMMMKYAGERMDDVYFVNPGRDEVFGRRCWKSLGELPDKVDLVVVATPKSTVESIVREAAQIGAAGAVIYASGYGETGKPEDKESEASLKGLCNELGLAVMGPNCAGFINLVDRVPAMGFMTTVTEEAGKVGLVSQSGMICTLLLDSGKTSFSYVISCGNSKIVDVVDYLDFLVDDDDTSVVASYLEGVTDPRKFVAVLKKAALKQKPIVLLKVGRSEAGSRSAASHTGSLSGSDAAFDAIFKKYGVIRVDDLEDLIGMANILSTLRSLPKSDRVVSMNGSGGENGVSCDMGQAYGINFPAFSAGTAEKLRKLLPDYASVNNPLDTTATICYDVDAFANAAEAIINDPNFDLVLVGNTIENELTDLCVKYMSEGLVKLVNENRIDKPVIMVPAIESGRMPEYVNMLKEAGIPVTAPCYYAYKHVRKLLEYSEWRRNADIDSLPDTLPVFPTNGKRRVLSEHESKLLLGRYGVPIPEEIVARSADEAVTAAEKIGYPVVLKIESADILHKSDVGGVKLGIKDSYGVREAYETIIGNIKERRPDAVINGVLVQKMLDAGVETIVGVNRDPLLGPMVLFGLGGVLVELMKDVAIYPAPFSKEEALRMISSLKAARVFYGYRGKPALDVEAAADVLVSVSRLAAESGEGIAEIDINPLFVFEKGRGVAAGDGLIVIEK